MTSPAVAINPARAFASRSTGKLARAGAEGRGKVLFESAKAAASSHGAFGSRNCAGSATGPAEAIDMIPHTTMVWHQRDRVAFEIGFHPIIGH